MTEKRYKLIAIHPETGGCNLNCKFCYKDKKPKKGSKPDQFWYDLVPFMAKLTDQVAIGSNGEPFMNPEFIKTLSHLCKKSSLIANVTTNGKKLEEMDDKTLQDTLADITLVSISLDSEKRNTPEEIERYILLVKRIKALTNCEVGCNLLVEQLLLENKGIGFIQIVKFLFENEIDRVFALYPKNYTFLDIEPLKDVYKYLTVTYSHFYCDDLTKMILEYGYRDWKEPCHYAKDLVSINENGFITGCSFDPEDKSLLHLNNPKDLLKITETTALDRFNCPFLKIYREKYNEAAVPSIECNKCKRLVKAYRVDVNIVCDTCRGKDGQ